MNMETLFESGAIARPDEQTLDKRLFLAEIGGRDRRHGESRTRGPSDSLEPD